MIPYYEHKYYLTEEFYEYIFDEGYTIGQSAGRCFVESFSQISAYNFETLTVYSTILARVAKYEKDILSLFKKQLEEMNCLVKREDIFNDISADEITAIKEDINFINSKIIL